jgi:hypothetical protein
LGRLWFGGKQVAFKLRDAYATVPSHRDKLGIQEALGDDIRVLIAALVGGDAGGLKTRLWGLVAILTILCAALPLGYLLIKRASILFWFTSPPGIVLVVWNMLLILSTLIALPWGRAALNSNSG